ncbi:DUF3445 domain-containing protein [Microbulbifer bruguierae]|uniref:DUF3445 domain-containing protein n=1 Tax=Microbulbifer bruguierae TaxID=3029061 RepID=A0ABY8NEQ5_9GAMM|nr:DUF3445 domain-containing protein [Microbulbifer bruguierae]WGL17401.1 DUF3445 domain-containing protein [Microbulbifer bruguierae]
MSPRRWIEPSPHLPFYLHNKLSTRRKLGERIYAQLPGALAAQRELVEILGRHLVADHASYCQTAGGGLMWRSGAQTLRLPGIESAHASASPLWEAGLWVADDLCILQPDTDGYTLVAASLAAPSYWRLEEKIGQPLTQIHRPVPGFQQKLGTQVTRFFDHLLPEYPVWRGNWSVVDSAELLQRGEAENDDDAGGGEKGLYLRVERQSLRRLPKTGAVVFSIRVTINPLADLLEIEGAVAALQRAVEAMSPQESKYKSIATMLPALHGFFAGANAASPSG